MGRADVDRAPSWAERARALQHDAAVRESLTRELAESAFAAFAWETVPVCAATQARPYRHVLLDSPQLARVTADPSPFAERIAAKGDVVRFWNLGQDAQLIVPTRPSKGPGYPHLAAFVRTAPAEVVHDLWIEVGRAVEEHLSRSRAPVWVSTAGLGVHWLHVRLDSSPKYYRHAPFREAPV